MRKESWHFRPVLKETRRLATCITIFLFSACISVNEPSAETVGKETSRTQASQRVERKKGGFNRRPTAREFEVIQELMAETEEVRGLSFIRPVPVIIQDRTAIVAHIESQIEDTELERAKAVYTALGLLSPELDIRTLLLRVLGEQILGYYDPEKDKLVVRDDVFRTIEKEPEDSAYPAVDEARVGLVHELVHALQSQHLALFENMERKRDNDAENAFRSLIEGDATLAMIGYMLRNQQPNAKLSQLTGNPAWIRSFAEMVNQMPMAGPELVNAPPIVRVPLLSAYVDGLAFVANLHGRGGWKAIDIAHKSPPTSTEQVLHPERFLRGDLPQVVDIPQLRALEKAGYRLVEDDTLGELEIRVYFAQGADENAARSAAEGWGWDRLRLYRNDNGETAVIWFTTWDDEDEARQAEKAAFGVLDRVLENQRELFTVARDNRNVLIVRQLPKRHHQEVLRVWKQWSELLSSPGGEAATI
ncbi:MAG: hypothetical protein JXA30_15895 [Deltaproteobacteria bacterium]|nr:hypothetical protein [Deltaproteobacteria bacterium]